MQRRGWRLEAGSFISPRLSTGSAHAQTSLPGAALSRGGGEELRGLHGPRGQLCQVSTAHTPAAATLWEKRSGTLLCLGFIVEQSIFLL